MNSHKIHIAQHTVLQTKSPIGTSEPYAATFLNPALSCTPLLISIRRLFQRQQVVTVNVLLKLLDRSSGVDNRTAPPRVCCSLTLCEKQKLYD